jgi:hypothetical protein
MDEAFCPRLTGNEEIFMFAYPNDTALHHEQQAICHRTLAGAARKRGSLAEADYQTELALRHTLAAQQQTARTADSMPVRASRHWPLVAPTPSYASVCMRAFQRFAGRMALQLSALLPGRSSSAVGLLQR